MGSAEGRAIPLHAFRSTYAKKFKTIFYHLPHGTEQRKTSQGQLMVSGKTGRNSKEENGVIFQ